MSYEHLKLQNQLCFPLYAASRLIIREYQPHLDALGITYPQYLVMMILWENDVQPVNDIAKRLILNTNTITPLLKRMESMGFISRERSVEDERKVLVKLTEKGLELKKEAAVIPENLSKRLIEGPFEIEDLIHLKQDLESLIKHLSSK